jgi:hypothetical protein
MAVIFIILMTFCLYSIFRGVEYRESIKRLSRDNESLRQANANLSKIIQDDLEKLVRYENECG